MAYFIKEVTDEELGWPFVISREELIRRLVNIAPIDLSDEYGNPTVNDEDIRMLVHGTKQSSELPKQFPILAKLIGKGSIPVLTNLRGGPLDV